MSIKKSLCLLLSFCMLFCSAPLNLHATAVGADPFDDVDASDWFYGAVLSVNGEGIMTGKTAAVFDPNAKITRAEVVTALARLVCVNVTGMGVYLDFPDTKTDAWYSDHAGWAYENGIITGYDNGKLGPADLITRQELAAVISRTTEYLEATLPNVPQINKFSDADKLTWAAEYVEKLRQSGVMNGDENGRFNPTDNASRAEVAMIISRLIPYSGRIAVAENGKTDYTVVVDEDDNGAVIAAERLKELMLAVNGAEVKVSYDTDTAGKVIVIGSASGIPEGDLGSDGYILSVTDDKILINGDADGLYKAAVRLVKLYTNNGDLKITAKTSEIYEHKYPVSSLTICGNSISEYVIKHDADASAAAKTAASELQKYIEKACGVKLDITTEDENVYALIIDEKALSNIESYSIKTNGNNIFISGTSRGILYGVCDFLETCIGVRFLTETDEYVKSARRLDISNVDYTKSPVFEYRGVGGDLYTSAAQAVKHGFNSISDYIMIPNELGGSYTAGYYDEYWFGDQFSDPCLTDEDNISGMVEKIFRIHDANKSLKIFSVTLNESWKICECANCASASIMEGGYAGVLIGFVNRIAEAVTERYPNVYVHTVVSGETLKPPKTAPHGNVIVQLHTDGRCYSHPLRAECNAELLSDIAGWAALTDKLFVWDSVSAAASPLTFDYDTLVGDIRLYAEYGICGIYERFDSENIPFANLRAYLSAKLIEEPYMSENEYINHITDYLEGLYGDGTEKLAKQLSGGLTDPNTFEVLLDELILFAESEAVREKLILLRESVIF